MILDQENLFSDNQTITASAPAANVIDLGVGDAGPAEGASLFVSASTAFTGGGALFVTLQTSDSIDAAGALVGPVDLVDYNIRNEPLVAGGKLVGARLPHGLKRYVGLKYEISGTLAAGAITAGLVWDIQAFAPAA